MGRFEDQVAIIGVGTTSFRALAQEKGVIRSAYDLAADAFASAVADAGIEKDEIDGLFSARVPSYLRMADVLGMRRPALINGFDGAGRMSAVSLQLAASAISSGLAETVALVYGNNGRSAGARYGGETPSPTGLYDAVYGMTSPGASLALMYRRYAEKNKAPDGALAPFAMNNRRNASLNPDAVFQTPFDEEEYLASPFIAEPLRLFDYCLINDGGVALILTSVERAKRLGKPVITISASASRGDLTNFYASDDDFYASCRAVADRVYGQAGIRASDVSCVQIYDNFTPTILFSLEGFGFAERGEGWRWAAEHPFESDDALVVNTSGGHTSESYMQGWALQAEAVRQLRGDSAGRQLPPREVVQYICASPIVTSHIFRRLE
ncbi:thiolase family protein [Microbacterium ulmi]|uniref:Thiolase family protein n=1 Tax=Microbacterium ulmi TaxID=179095 RepID=A0A7Y2PYC4_9MICO|nr:thiolase family protein [Microbacterium ulmi]NII69857.1 acetyl-CoA acetyltransferase [Microbacterium ulmi]NNH03176.1 thiolase family protein [Microbacterium ulmi]